MSTTIVVLIGMTVGTFALKSAGPLLLGGRALPPAVDQLAARLPAALLAALVVVSTVANGQSLTVDARVLGLGAAGVALKLKAPFVVVVVVAVAVTAAARAISGG